MFELPDYTEDFFRIDAKRLHEELFDGRADLRYSKHHVADCLKKEYGLLPEKSNSRMRIPKLENREDVREVSLNEYVDENGELAQPYRVEWKSAVGKCYVFKKGDFQ